MKNNPFYSILPVAVVNDTPKLIEDVNGDDYEIKYVAFYNPSKSTDVSELDIYDSIDEVKEDYNDANVYAEALMDSIYEHLHVSDAVESDLFTEDIILSLCGWSKTTLAGKFKNKTFAQALQHEMETDCEPFDKKGRAFLRATADLSTKEADDIISALTDVEHLTDLYGEGAPLLYTDATHSHVINIIEDDNGGVTYTLDRNTQTVYNTVEDALAASKHA